MQLLKLWWHYNCFAIVKCESISVVTSRVDLLEVLIVDIIRALLLWRVAVYYRLTQRHA
jgi:hypothetical protein